MKKSEIALLIVIIAGLALKLFHPQGTAIILILLFSSLSIFYLASGWYLFKQEKQNSTIPILTGFVFSIAMVGVLFKIQIWPGAEGMLSVTNTGIVLLLSISGFLYARTKEKYYKTMLTRLMLMAILTGTLYLLPAREVIKIYHSDDPEYARLFIQAEENPNNQEYQKAFEEYRRSKTEHKNNK